MAARTPARQRSASDSSEADTNVTVLGAKLRNVVAKASLAELQVRCCASWLETAPVSCSELAALTVASAANRLC